ncbi:hypothetical protein I7I51_08957 [Histoplasma capsulatum]|uniref:Uncharacterized protein n=1 Tax=Ajellomyces capsulatus TaxID=5037 RepID=A0A8A1M4Z5_AJECA|nr:hypothetical protein I7I51_08957 [Histoplasma capsulatum]
MVFGTKELHEEKLRFRTRTDPANVGLVRKPRAMKTYRVARPSNPSTPTNSKTETRGSKRPGPVLHPRKLNKQAPGPWALCCPLFVSLLSFAALVSCNKPRAEQKSTGTAQANAGAVTDPECDRSYMVDGRTTKMAHQLAASSTRPCLFLRQSLWPELAIPNQRRAFAGKHAMGIQSDGFSTLESSRCIRSRPLNHATSSGQAQHTVSGIAVARMGRRLRELPRIVDKLKGRTILHHTWIHGTPMHPLVSGSQLRTSSIEI